MLSSWFAKEGASQNTQVVFASSDKDQGSFNGYLKSMSWDLAIPFGSAAKDALSAKFKVRGIPTVAIVDAKTGDIITTDGREGFSTNPAAFPFRPRSLDETFAASTVINSAGDKQTLTELVSSTAVDYLVFYFSASWCGPCKGFTPRLKTWYESKQAAPAAGKTFEIVLVSGDRTPSDFAAYFEHMPWSALSFDCKESASDFNKLFNVEGIPTVAVLDAKTKKVVTPDARPLVLEFPDEFPWLPTPVSRFAQAVGGINDKKTVLLFTDKATASTDAVEAGLTAAAEAYFGGDVEIQFAVVTAEAGMSDRLRGFLKYSSDADGPDSVRLVLLDIPSGCKYDLGSSIAALAKDGAVKDAVDSVFNGKTSPVGLS
jgi:nucleoredoxin